VEALQAIRTGKTLMLTTDTALPSGQALRVEATVRMALAKQFLFNANRAHRLCTKNKSKLTIDREPREKFLRATKCLTDVRNVNEHGFDGDERSRKNKPSMHEHDEAFLDEISLVFDTPNKILMGPLNLVDIYDAVRLARSVAGFQASASAAKDETSD